MSSPSIIDGVLFIVSSGKIGLSSEITTRPYFGRAASAGFAEAFCWLGAGEEPEPTPLELAASSFLFVVEELLFSLASLMTITGGMDWFGTRWHENCSDLITDFNEELDAIEL